MLWSFIAVCLSAWLSVDASYRGPTWQRWVFKPLTLLLLLLLAWQAPMFDAISYLVLAGLCASLLGDALIPVATSTSDVRHRRVFPLAPAVHHLFRQSDDALFLLASAVGAAGSGRAVTGDYLDASGRVSLAYLHVYRHDAGDGVAGR